MGQSYFCIIKLCSCFFDFFLSPPPCCKTFTRVDNMLVLLHIFLSSKSKLYGYNADVSKICGIWSYVKHHLNLPALVLSAQDSCHDRSYIRSWTFCSLSWPMSVRAPKRPGLIRVQSNALFVSDVLFRLLLALLLFAQEN